MGDRYEDIGVVTGAAQRGRLRRGGGGRRPGPRPAAGGSTSPDNTAGPAVAARLGFVHHRDDVLYGVVVPVPG